MTTALSQKTKTDETETSRQTGGSIHKVAVIFEVTPTIEGKAEYFKLGAALKDELQKMPGFISVERFASMNNEGKFLSLSFWENEQAAAGWRRQMNHRASQKKGRDALFVDYRISAGEIVREYTDKNRSEAPADSSAYPEDNPGNRHREGVSAGAADR